MKPILLFGGPALAQQVSDLTKAQVAGYTRSDGTFVQEHQDSRTEAKQSPVANPRAHAHLKDAHAHREAKARAEKAGNTHAAEWHDRAATSHEWAAKEHMSKGDDAEMYSSFAKQASRRANKKFSTKEA